MIKNNGNNVGALLEREWKHKMYCVNVWAKKCWKNNQNLTTLKVKKETSYYKRICVKLALLVFICSVNIMKITYILFYVTYKINNNVALIWQQTLCSCWLIFILVIIYVQQLREKQIGYSITACTWWLSLKYSKVTYICNPWLK